MQAGNPKLPEAAARDVKHVALKSFANFTGKNLCWSLFLIKLEFWGPATLLKKTPTHVCSVKFKSFLRTIILKNICERLLPNIVEKETQTQVLSCELYKLFKNTYFLVYSQTAWSQTPVRGSFFNKLASLTPWELLTLLERDRRTGISPWILRKFLGKLFYRTPPSNHFLHEVAFFFFSDQWGLQRKISSSGGAMVN